MDSDRFHGHEQKWNEALFFLLNRDICFFSLCTWCIELYSILDEQTHSEIESHVDYNWIKVTGVSPASTNMAHAALVALYQKDLRSLYTDLQGIHSHLSHDLEHNQIEHINGCTYTNFSMDKYTRKIEDTAKWIRSLHIACQSACTYALPAIVDLEEDTYQTSE